MDRLTTRAALAATIGCLWSTTAGAAAAPAYPPYPATRGIPEVAAWIRAQTDLDLGAVVGIGDDSVFALEPSREGAQPPALRATIRQESINPDFARTVGGRSMVMVVDIDCEGRQVLQRSLDLYAGNNKQGAVRRLGAGADWQPAPVGTFMDNVVSAVCDPAYQPLFPAGQIAPPQLAAAPPSPPPAAATRLQPVMPARRPIAPVLPTAPARPAPSPPVQAVAPAPSPAPAPAPAPPPLPAAPPPAVVAAAPVSPDGPIATAAPRPRAVIPAAPPQVAAAPAPPPVSPQPPTPEPAPAAAQPPAPPPVVAAAPPPGPAPVRTSPPAPAPPRPAPAPASRPAPPPAARPAPTPPAVAAQAPRPAPSAGALGLRPLVLGRADIGLFQSTDAALLAWRELATTFPREMAGKRSRIELTTSSGRTLFRGFVDGFAGRAEAQAFCRLLAARGQTCTALE